jgi:NitT/TauT family transport system permease protein
MFKRRANPIDLGIGLLVILLAIVLFRDSPHVYSLQQPSLNLDVRYLPFYALASVSRMIAAMILSLIIGLLAGYMAAVSRRWNLLILPAADILQSVPVLGFFPAAVFLFIRIFGDTYPAIGVEMAAIFLIITSALWNLIFAVYESVTTIPNDLMLASQQFGLRGYSHWTRVVLPAVMHKLAYNSMISWANGWYFLIASEIIVMGQINYRLPGLGSYLGQTMSSGDYSHAIYGVLVLAAIMVFFHLIVWSPLNAWSVRFLYDTAEMQAEARRMPSRSRLRFHIARSRVLHALWDGFFRPVIRSMVFFLSLILERQRTRRGSAALAVVLMVLGILLVRGMWTSVSELRDPSPEMHAVPMALFLSLLRLIAAYLLALVWALPLAVWVGRNEHISRRLLPILEVVASIPATAFFPLIVLTIIRFGGNMNLASIILVTTGMQWYLLFNLIAGIRGIPEDLYQISDSLGLSGLTRWKRLILPAIFPSLVTGSLTAIGGGWNALVLSEYVFAEGQLYSVNGIGAILARATYDTGNLQQIVVSITAMVLFILIVNRLVWQPAYNLAQRRFALNY